MPATQATGEYVVVAFCISFLAQQEDIRFIRLVVIFICTFLSDAVGTTFGEQKVINAVFA